MPESGADSSSSAGSDLGVWFSVAWKSSHSRLHLHLHNLQQSTRRSLLPLPLRSQPGSERHLVNNILSTKSWGLVCRYAWRSCTSSRTIHPATPRPFSTWRRRLRKETNSSLRTANNHNKTTTQVCKNMETDMTSRMMKMNITNVLAEP